MKPVFGWAQGLVFLIKLSAADASRPSAAVQAPFKVFAYAGCNLAQLFLGIMADAELILT